MFQGAHSLGGAVLEGFIEDHTDLSAGIMLFGSYVADITEGEELVPYPVPVLTGNQTVIQMKLKLNI